MEKKIDAYYTKEASESAATKRARSEGSSVGDSPSSKKQHIFGFDSEDIELPDDAPFWVPLMFKCLDRVNEHIVQIGSKFEKFTSDINEKIQEVQKQADTKIESVASTVKEFAKEQNDKISELEKSVVFLSGYGGITEKNEDFRRTS